MAGADTGHRYIGATMETFWAVVSITLVIGFLALPLVLLALLWHRAGRLVRR
ncbi:MAG: hypothetical protein ACXVHQ_40660 [Solirubrobacteraceae bacterium]